MFIYMVAHNCHGKLKFTTANSNSLRKIKIHHGKLKFTGANSNSPRQIQIHHRKFKIHRGKFKFTTTNSNSPRQIQIHHRKFKIHHDKFKFTTANSKSLLTVRFATGVGLVLGGFGLVLVVRASFCGGLRGLLGFRVG